MREGVLDTRHCFQPFSEAPSFLYPSPTHVSIRVRAVNLNWVISAAPGLRLYLRPAVTLARHKKALGSNTQTGLSLPLPIAPLPALSSTGMGEGWDRAADGNLLPTASQMDSRLTSGGLTPQKVLKMGPLKHFCLEPGRPREPVDSFNSSLGGHNVAWAGQSWVARCPPLNPASMPAPSVGSENGWDRLLCPDKYPPGHHPEPTTSSTASGWVAEWKIPPTSARRGRGLCQEAWQCPNGMSRPRWVAKPRTAPSEAGGSAYFLDPSSTSCLLPANKSASCLTQASLGARARLFGGQAAHETTCQPLDKDWLGGGKPVSYTLHLWCQPGASETGKRAECHLHL